MLKCIRHGKDPCANDLPTNGLPKKDKKMKTLSRMMTASAAAFGTLAFMAMAAPAAQAGEFCMTDSSGMRGCGYTTMEQCHASAAGKNGSCDRDPFFNNASSSSNALAYQPKGRAHTAKPSAVH